MTPKQEPSLFGLTNSNRDFKKKETWGKNQFNSSFPTALACYMNSKELEPVYIKTDSNMKNKIENISVTDLFGVNPSDGKIYFSFETQFSNFQKYIIGSIPRNDLVIMLDNKVVSSLEIKLVALPDNSTCELDEDKFGSEIVVRPDTIIYLACSIISSYKNDELAKESLKKIIGDLGDEITDWTEPLNIIPFLKQISEKIKLIVSEVHENQIPIIMEPVWKTEGKSAQLSESCLDIFVWSNLGMLNLFMPSEGDSLTNINRFTRTMVWLFKMLKEYSENGKFDGAEIINSLTYNSKNDKAFSSNGLKTWPLMNCPELRKPRVTKSEIKNIILGGGQNMLSPERRFDAIIFNSPDLF